ncbi:Os06g0164300, partial [Oryza sativa Japonica Group]
RRCLLLHVFSVAVVAGAMSFTVPRAAVKPMAKPAEKHVIYSNYGKNHHTLVFHVCMHATVCTVTSKPKWLIAKLYSFGHEDVYRYTLISQVQEQFGGLHRPSLS